MGLSFWMWLVRLILIPFFRLVISSANLLLWQKQIISISAAASSSTDEAFFRVRRRWMLSEWSWTWTLAACLLFLLRHRSSLLNISIPATSLFRWVREEKSRSRQPYFFLKKKFNSWTLIYHVCWVVSSVDVSPLVCMWYLMNFSDSVGRRRMESGGLVVDIFEHRGAIGPEYRIC